MLETASQCHFQYSNGKTVPWTSCQSSPYLLSSFMWPASFPLQPSALAAPEGTRTSSWMPWMLCSKLKFVRFCLLWPFLSPPTWIPFFSHLNLISCQLLLTHGALKEQLASRCSKRSTEPVSVLQKQLSSDRTNPCVFVTAHHLCNDWESDSSDVCDWRVPHPFNLIFGKNFSFFA